MYIYIYKDHDFYFRPLLLPMLLQGFTWVNIAAIARLWYWTGSYDAQLAKLIARCLSSLPFQKFHFGKLELVGM